MRESHAEYLDLLTKLTDGVVPPSDMVKKIEDENRFIEIVANLFGNGSVDKSLPVWRIK